MGTNNRSIQSINRTIQIIETLSTFPQGASLAELASYIDLPKSTLYRILSTLIINGYVTKNNNQKYQNTMRMFEIGSRVANELNLTSISRPYINKLSNITNEAIHLVVRDGIDVIYLYKEDSPNSILRMSSRVGLRNPMYCTAVGKSILALLPADELESIWNKSTIVRFTPTTITTLDEMKHECELIRSAGYALDNEEHELGVRCIGVAILDFSGVPVGALSISAPVTRMDDETINRYVPYITKFASNISKILGYK